MAAPLPSPYSEGKKEKEPLLSMGEVSYAMAKLRRQNGLVLAHREMIRLALTVLGRAMASSNDRIAIEAAVRVLRVPARSGCRNHKQKVHKVLKDADQDIQALAKMIDEQDQSG